MTPADLARVEFLARMRQLAAFLIIAKREADKHNRKPNWSALVQSACYLGRREKATPAEFELLRTLTIEQLLTGTTQPPVESG